MKKFEFFDIVVYGVCGAMTLFALYPMWYVLIMSVTDPLQPLRGIYLIPKGFTLEGYWRILHERQMWLGTFNSIIYVISGTLLALVTSVLMAYPLTRPNLMFRRFVVVYLLIPMYLGGGMIPYFLLLQKLGMYNTRWALILPGYGIFFIILVRTYLMSLPNDMADSAFIDGANNFQVMSMIYVPLAKPVLAVVAIYSIVGIWNSWFGAMVYVPKVEYQPLQMFLKRVLIDSTINLAQSDELAKALSPEDLAALSRRAMSARQLKYVVIMICSLPIIMTYPLFQKHFVKGVMLGSLKG